MLTVSAGCLAVNDRGHHPIINISIGSYGMTTRLTYGQELASVAAEDLLEISDTRASGDIEKLEIGEVL